MSPTFCTKLRTCALCTRALPSVLKPSVRMRARSTAPLICTGIYMESVGRGPAFRSLFIADSAFLIARSRDSTHVRLLAAPSTTAPHEEDAERDKLAEKDGYGVRNDAGWTPQLVCCSSAPRVDQISELTCALLLTVSPSSETFNAGRATATEHRAPACPLRLRFRLARRPRHRRRYRQGESSLRSLLCSHQS